MLYACMCVCMCVYVHMCMYICMSVYFYFCGAWNLCMYQTITLPLSSCPSPSWLFLVQTFPIYKVRRLNGFFQMLPLVSVDINDCKFYDNDEIKDFKMLIALNSISWNLQWQNHLRLDRNLYRRIFSNQNIEYFPKKSTAYISALRIRSSRPASAT